MTHAITLSRWARQSRTAGAARRRARAFSQFAVRLGPALRLDSPLLQSVPAAGCVAAFLVELEAATTRRPGCAVLVQVVQQVRYVGRSHPGMAEQLGPGRQVVAVTAALDGRTRIGRRTWTLVAALTLTRGRLGTATICHEAVHVVARYLQAIGIRRTSWLSNRPTARIVRAGSGEELVATLVGEVARGIVLGLDRAQVLPR